MVLKRLQSRNMPERIDSEYLRDCGVPEGTLARTLFGLRFVGLITEAGAPTQELRAIGSATVEEYHSILSQLVRTAYADVFNVVDPTEDSQERIANVFRKYSPASQRTRMVVFFLGICREAGIPTLDTPRQRAMGTGTVKPKAFIAPKPTMTGRGRIGGATETAFVPAGLSDIHPALIGVMRSLPAPGTPMTRESREQWLAMAGATLGFIYPAKPSIDIPDGQPDPNEQEDEEGEEE
jgi:hypothetical protein